MNTKSPSGVRVAAGSVVGRTHRRAGRGNQDAFAIEAGAAATIAVVCDGCGSGARSEVGAALGARLWAAALSARIGAGTDLADDAPWLDARAAVLAHLRALVDAMRGAGDAAPIVREHFLFTTVIAAWTEAQVAVAAIGDGVVAIDRDVRELGPFADNQPPYLGYGLVGDPPAFTTRAVRPAATVDAVLIASDGAAALQGGTLRDADGEPVGDLGQFTGGERWFRNPDALRRRLAVINREDTGIDWARGAITRSGAPLEDDTTIVVLRRSVS